MRVLLQRVASASVAVGDRITGQIGRGLLLLTGFGKSDTIAVIDPMADKICGLRVFEDQAGRFQHSVDEVEGELLVVPQFTLYGDTQRGRRPDFTPALAPDPARGLFENFARALDARLPGRVASGEFGAHMAVRLLNDGPVTLMLEKDPV